MLQRSRRGGGIIEPCLPSPAKVPPSVPYWVHEIKHAGFRILPLRDATGLRLYTRIGNDSDRQCSYARLGLGMRDLVLRQ